MKQPQISEAPLGEWEAQALFHIDDFTDRDCLHYQRLVFLLNQQDLPMCLEVSCGSVYDVVSKNHARDSLIR